MTQGRVPTLALVACLTCFLTSCTNEGDTITYENPAPSPPASGSIVEVTSTNILVNVSPSAPSTVLSTTPIVGLVSGENVVGLDYRPADQRLYGWTSGGRLYRIDPVTGIALQVGVTPLIIGGSWFGFDFTPVADRVRIVTEQDFNVRVNPTDGSSVGDGTLAYDPGDVNAGTNPWITGLAYSNNVAGATTTTLYGIEQTGNRLVIMNPPNSGTLFTVGSLGLAAPVGSLGFDIAPNGTAYAGFLGSNGAVNLYTINLTTGTASLLGLLGTGAPIGGLTVVP